MDTIWYQATRKNAPAWKLGNDILAPGTHLAHTQDSQMKYAFT